MSVIPARCLTSHDLSLLERNTVAAAKADRESRPPKPPASGASFSTVGDEPLEPEPFERVIEEALRSQHVAG